MGPGYITLAELDAFVADDSSRNAHVGGSVVLQQPNESAQQVLIRLQRSARVLRESGYEVTTTSLLLGVHDAGRLAERLELAHGLLALLADSSATLHLVSTATEGEKVAVFELVGWLLAESRQTPAVHLTFREREPGAFLAPAHRRLPPESGVQALALTA